MSKIMRSTIVLSYFALINIKFFIPIQSFQTIGCTTSNTRNPLIKEHFNQDDDGTLLSEKHPQANNFAKNQSYIIIYEILNILNKLQKIENIVFDNNNDSTLQKILKEFNSSDITKEKKEIFLKTPFLMKFINEKKILAISHTNFMNVFCEFLIFCEKNINSTQKIFKNTKTISSISFFNVKFRIYSSKGEESQSIIRYECGQNKDFEFCESKLCLRNEKMKKYENLSAKKLKSVYECDILYYPKFLIVNSDKKMKYFFETYEINTTTSTKNDVPFYQRNYRIIGFLYKNKKSTGFNSLFLTDLVVKTEQKVQTLDNNILNFCKYGDIHKVKKFIVFLALNN